MKCLVTGGSGFIGANLVRRLLADGHDVLGLTTGSTDNGRPLYKPHRWTADIRSESDVEEAFLACEPDWVFHLAAYGCYPNQTDFRRMVNVNIHGTRNVLEAAIRHGVTVFVNAGSSSEYGGSVRWKSPEGPVKPDSDYAVTKAAQTHLVHAMSAGKIRATTLRFFSVYGPWEEPSRLIPQLILQGEQGKLPPLGARGTPRCLVYVDDAVDALVKAAEVQDASGVFNIGPAGQWRLAQIVELAREALKIEASPVYATYERAYHEPVDWFNEPGSERVAKNQLGLKYFTQFPIGLLKTLAWHRETGAWK